MMYMLDTNAIIMAIRHPDWPISSKIEKHLGIDLCISSITYAELVYGIKKSNNPQKSRLAVSQILYGIKILDFDQKAAEEFGDIFADLEQKHQRIGDRDTLIAAHARALGYTLVTNNTKEFCRVKNLKVEDWK